MASTTVQDQATLLLQQQVAEAKIRGSPAPDIEAAAILQSIATSLILTPKSVLYVALLAKNGFLAALASELAQIQTVIKDVDDVGNQTFEITDVSALEQARVALLNIENSQQQIAANNSSFGIYLNGVNSFLNNQLAQNVKTPGATALVRTSAEAQTDLATDFAQLQTLHADTIDRFYALAVGIQNFLSSPIGMAIGLSAATRSRQDIDSILASISASNSGAASRDFATRLITAKAVLSLLGTTPDITKPQLDSVSQLPAGYNVIGTSDPATAQATTSAGPFTFTATDSLLADVNGTIATQLASTIFPAVNQPAILSSAVSYPVTISSGQNLFLVFQADPSQTFSVQPDGTYTATTVALGAGWNLQPDGTFTKVYRVPLTAGSRSITQIVADINAVIGSPSIGLAAQFASTNQILIYGFSNAPNVYFSRIGIGLSSPSLVVPYYFANSAHATLGFGIHQFGIPGTTTELALAGLEAFFSSLFTFKENTNGTITLTSIANTPGTSALFSGGVATTLGLAASYLATDDTVTLSGSVLGVPTNPVNPIGLFDVGDLFTSSTGSASIASIAADEFVLSAALPTFSGSITIRSILYAVWTLFNQAIQTALTPWLQTRYSQNLNVINAAIAPLSGAPTPAFINSARALLNDLSTQIGNLLTTFSSGSFNVPAGGAAKETVVINNIISTLQERKYDRAQDFFLRCKIADIFTMDWQTLSYGGNFLRAAMDVARTDVQFVNTTTDQQGQVKASQSRTGLPG
jgi:hypothetical protein